MVIMLYTLATLALQAALLISCVYTLRYASRNVGPEFKRRNLILTVILFVLFLSVAYFLPILHFPTA